MAGLLTVLVVATLVQKWVKDNAVEPAAIELDVSEPQGSFARWGRCTVAAFLEHHSTLCISPVLVLGATHASGYSRMPTAIEPIP